MTRVPIFTARISPNLELGSLKCRAFARMSTGADTNTKLAFLKSTYKLQGKLLSALNLSMLYDAKDISGQLLSVSTNPGMDALIFPPLNDYQARL